MSFVNDLLTRIHHHWKMDDETAAKVVAGNQFRRQLRDHRRKS
jgi:hypothetical protein